MNRNEVVILLVEDNKADAELTIRALKNSNVTNHIAHVENGAQALDFLFGRKEYAHRDICNRPKLILLDLNMPRMGGPEFLERIKADELTRKIPVVILSGSKEDADLERSYASGAFSYLIKPLEAAEFHRVMNGLGLCWMLSGQDQ